MYVPVGTYIKISNPTMKKKNNKLKNKKVLGTTTFNVLASLPSKTHNAIIIRIELINMKEKLICRAGFIL